MTRGGKLDINIDSVRLVTGDKTALRAVKEGSGGGHTGAMVGAMVATSIVFFPAAPLFLFMKGKDVTVPKGTEITAYVNGDTPLELARFASPQPAPPAQDIPAQAVSSPQQVPAQPIEPSTVIIKSTPDGADITIDGKFVGSTPSTLQLAPGDHEIVIQKAGSSAQRFPGDEVDVSLRTYRAWKRTLSLSPGSTITVDATLEPMR